MPGRGLYAPAFPFTKRILIARMASLMKMNDYMIDEEYNIETCICDNTKEDKNHRAYEPTPYDVLDLLVENRVILRDDQVVDMGCGKGRVGIYLSNKTGCFVKGIEFDTEIYNGAVNNASLSKRTVNVEFLNMSAEDYEVDKEDTAFFFFNPFSVSILSKVLSNIEKSFYENPRIIKLIFYFPTLEFVGELTMRDQIDFVDEIDCSHLYKDSKGRECIMIFEYS